MPRTPGYKVELELSMDKPDAVPERPGCHQVLKFKMLDSQPMIDQLLKGIYPYPEM